MAPLCLSSRSEVKGPAFSRVFPRRRTADSSASLRNHTVRAGLPLIVSLLFAFVLSPAVHAQRHSTALSEGEEESVRDAADDPAKRVAVYQSIIETRVKRIQDILADKRAQGRREDIRQNMDEIAGLTDELEDNLDEYGAKHRDLRKPLPKLLDATLRWESVLKQPPVDDSYDLVRKLALEAVDDVKKDAQEMLPEQQAYFKAHPPDKSANPGGVGPVRPHE